MNLDDVAGFRKLDSQNMIAQINGLPDQLSFAYSLGKTLPLPEKKDFRHILISGMGGSAIGADLVAAYGQDKISLPVVVHRDYELPLWVDEHTLVIASSHSGNTEETLWAFEQARQRGCSIVSICTGGKLATLAREYGLPLWQFEHFHAPRSAVGFSFGLILALFEQLGFIPSVQQEIEEAVHAMRNVQTSLGVDVPVMKFIEKAREVDADIIGISALLTTTMTRQKDVIEALEDSGLRARVKVMVGGAPVTQGWADEIGADGYSEDAVGSVNVARQLMGKA